MSRQGILIGITPSSTRLRDTEAPAGSGSLRVIWKIRFFSFIFFYFPGRQGLFSFFFIFLYLPGRQGFFYFFFIFSFICLDGKGDAGSVLNEDREGLHADVVDRGWLRTSVCGKNIIYIFCGKRDHFFLQNCLSPKP